MRTRLRTKLSIRIVAIILVTSAGAGWYTYNRSVREYDNITGRIIQNTSALVDERMDAQLGSAENNARILASLTRPSIGETTRVGLYVSDLHSIAPQMVEMMQINSLFSSVRLTIERSGESLQVVRQSDGSLIGIVRANAESGMTTREFRPYGGVFSEYSKSDRTVPDPRKEGWYQACATRRELTWNSDTLLSPTRGVRVPCATIACPIFNRRNEFLGVASVDISYEDLSRFLQTINVSNRGVAFLVELDDSVPRIVAFPNASRFLVTAGGTQRLAATEELGMPEVGRFINLLSTNQVQTNGLNRIQFRIGGEIWQGSWLMIQGPNAPRWATCILIPASDFTNNVRETALFVLFGTLIALALGVGMTIIIAERISRPLGALVRETRRIQELDFTERPLPRTDVIEVAELAGSIEQVKRGLRSFEKLVPSEYARYLITSGQEARLGGAKQRLTVSFADLVGFTALSETVAPEELGKILEEYLDVLSAEVLRTHGTIDKYNGDDVMAFWGAPAALKDHALAACQSALAMRDTLIRLYPEWQERGIPRLGVSCGIVTGDMIVGNVGSRERMNYTVIGDAVNLASRLQGLNRFYGTELLIADSTQREVDREVLTRLLDWVIPVGKEHVVAIYELIAMREKATENQVALAQRFEAGMALYRERKWDEAMRKFEEVYLIAPNDGPTRVLIDRCRRYKESPPEEEWQGAFRVGFK